MTPAEYKALRKSIGRQKEVAAVLGISRSHLSHRESGAVPLTTECIFAILYLDLRKSLITNTPPKKAPNSV